MANAFNLMAVVVKYMAMQTARFPCLPIEPRVSPVFQLSQFSLYVIIYVLPSCAKWISSALGKN